LREDKQHQPYDRNSEGTEDLSDTKSEVEVPFDAYAKYCYPCMYRIETLTPQREYVQQYTLPPDKRGSVKLRCSKPIPCPQTGKWESIAFVARIRRSVKAPLPICVLSWSARNRAEDGVYGYYWTEEANKLLKLLKTVPEGLLVGVMGYSGQGKTALKMVLSQEMKRFFKEKEPEATLPGEELQVSIPKWDKDVYNYWMEQVKYRRRMKHRRAFFIDTSDYGRKDLRLINRDLTQLSEFWTALRAHGYDVNVVIFLQKELVKAQQHFFLLKMYPLLELPPLKPEEMLASYKQIFRNYTSSAKPTEPFTEEALTLVAQLSKGIFRRLMRYINLTVLNMLQKGKDTVNVEDVKAVITDAVLMQDAELEFSEMFKNETHKQQAVRLLAFLREQREANQKTIAEALGLSEMAISRLMVQLESHGYVKRRRGKHGEWLVSITE
jgi:biotin operon repressor